MAVLRIFADVSVWTRCLIASRWKLCSEGEILFVFSENVGLALYPVSFYILKIFLWTCWMRYFCGYTTYVFQGSLEDFCRCFGLTSMFDRIWMKIVQWRRNFICFLWKCKSFTVTWKLLLFKNLSLNELNATYLRVYLVVFQGSLEDFCRCFGLTSMFDHI